jgi:VWFA-related protein
MDYLRTFKALPIGMIFLVGCLPLWGQEAKPSSVDVGHAISVQTEMVRIPAIVTDRAGAPISDLTVHDFSIRENGRPQKIAFFEHIQSKPELAKPKDLTEGEVSNRYEEGPGRLTIILLDMLNTSFADQERARRGITKYLAERVSSTEPVSLMTLNANGVNVIHDFTTDPRVLADALKHVGGQRSLSETVQPVPLSSIMAKRSPLAESDRLRDMETQGQISGFYGVMGVRLTLVSLREIGEAFAGVSGRKSLIWATGGLPFPVNDNYAVDTWLHGLTTMYQDTWAALDRAEIAVYPLDVEGLVNLSYRSPAYPRSYYSYPSFRTSVSGMEEFAKMTGGRMCYVKTEIEGCMREATADSSDYYVLGFYPEPNRKRTGWRKISVWVERADAKVVARTSYFAGAKRDVNSGRKEDLQLGLVSPLDYTDLPLTVRWVGNTEISGKKKVGFQFRLAPGQATVDEAGGNHVSMDFAAMALSAKGNVEAQFSKRMEGRIGAAQVNALKTGTAFFPGDFELAPGDYMVRFVARDNLNGRMGSISTPLRVP